MSVRVVRLFVSVVVLACLVVLGGNGNGFVSASAGSNIELSSFSIGSMVATYEAHSISSDSVTVSIASFDVFPYGPNFYANFVNEDSEAQISIFTKAPNQKTKMVGKMEWNKKGMEKQWSLDGNNVAGHFTVSNSLTMVVKSKGEKKTFRIVMVEDKTKDMIKLLKFSVGSMTRVYQPSELNDDMQMVMIPISNQETFPYGPTFYANFWILGGQTISIYSTDSLGNKQKLVGNMEWDKAHSSLGWSLSADQWAHLKAPSRFAMVVALSGQEKTYQILLVDEEAKTLHNKNSIQRSANLDEADFDSADSEVASASKETSFELKPSRSSHKVRVIVDLE